VSLKILLGFIFLGAIAILALLFGYPKEYYHLLFFIGLNQVILSLLLYSRSNLSGLGKYRLDSVLSVLDKVLLILILLYLLSVHNSDFIIDWFVFSQTVALGVTCIVTFSINIYLAGHFQFQLSIDFIKSHLRKSLPYALIIFLMTVYTRMDGVMLERLLDDQAREAGIYAAAFRIFDAGNMFAYLFAGLLFPMFAHLLAKKESIIHLLEMGYKLLFIGAFVLFIACIFYRDSIMVFLYPNHADPYYGVLLGYLMFSFLAMAVAYAFGSLLSANGNVSALNKLFLVGVLLNFSLNLWLIPRNQALGAAIATVVTQYFVLFGQIFLCRKYFRIHFKFKLLSQLFALVLSVLLLFYVLAFYTPLPWFVEISLGIIFSILVSLLLRLVEIKEFKRIYS
jgi:O-antigen/teichoic acid export membrane protein